MRAKFSPHILLKTMPCLTKNVAQNLHPYQVSQSLPRSGKALVVTKNMAKMEPFLQFSIEINNPFHLRRDRLSHLIRELFFTESLSSCRAPNTTSAIRDTTNSAADGRHDRVYPRRPPKPTLGNSIRSLRRNGRRRGSPCVTMKSQWKRTPATLPEATATSFGTGTLVVTQRTCGSRRGNEESSSSSWPSAGVRNSPSGSPCMALLAQEVG
jgi:hypothetical protein